MCAARVGSNRQPARGYDHRQSHEKNRRSPLDPPKLYVYKEPSLGRLTSETRAQIAQASKSGNNGCVGMPITVVYIFYEPRGPAGIDATEFALTGAAKTNYYKLKINVK
jgi:hypothetical protein